MTAAHRSLQSLAEQVVERAMAMGATAADALVMESDSFSVQVRLGEVENTTGARDKGLGLRVFQGDRSATASTSDFSPEGIERFITDNCALAKLTEADPYSGLPDDAGPAGDDTLELCDGGVTLSIDDRIDLARRAEAAATGADARITNSEGASFDSSVGEVAYARSNGFAGAYSVSSYGLSAVPVAEEEDGGLQRDYWFTGSRHFSDLETPESVGENAARRVLRRLGAKKVPTCEVPIIFESDVAASLMSHLAGAVSGNAVYKGVSFLGDKLGEKIAAPGVTIIDDGCMPRALGSRPFDGEGVPVGRNVVVDDGVLKHFLLDTYSAKKLSMVTTGSAARGLGGTPSPGSSNFYLKPGEQSPEEIIRGTSRGLFVTELIGFGVNGVTGDYSRGAAGIWIENGELTHPVEEVTISGNLLQMYQDIEAIGNDLVFRRRTVSPTVKIARMMLAGT
ncbi:MAG: TldD/PmbA family protein [Leptospirillia bacterium]